MAERIGGEFMKRTGYRYLSMTDQMKGCPPPPLELPAGEGGSFVELPLPDTWNAAPLTITQAIANRKSVREFSEIPLETEELSYLLWCTQGVKEVIPGKATFRTVPSAGARHPFETYLLVNNVRGVAPGLYRFLAIEHKLAWLKSHVETAEALTAGCLGQTMVKRGAAAFFWTAVQYRMTWRYGERGYRYIFLDAGHVCQNLYLASEAVGCGTCAIAAFDDEAVNAVLGLDGVEQFVIYSAVVGKKKA